MRSKFKEKSLSSVMKDPEMLKYAMTELQRIEKLRKETELYNNPKTKMFGMLLKAKRVREEEAAEKLGGEKLERRQEFCMMYVITKNAPPESFGESPNTFSLKKLLLFLKQTRLSKSPTICMGQIMEPDIREAYEKWIKNN